MWPRRGWPTGARSARSHISTLPRSPTVTATGRPSTTAVATPFTSPWWPVAECRSRWSTSEPVAQSSCQRGTGPLVAGSAAMSAARPRLPKRAASTASSWRRTSVVASRRRCADARYTAAADRASGLDEPSRSANTRPGSACTRKRGSVRHPSAALVVAREASSRTVSTMAATLDSPADTTPRSQARQALRRVRRAGRRRGRR